MDDPSKCGAYLGLLVVLTLGEEQWKSAVIQRVARQTADSFFLG